MKGNSTVALVEPPVYSKAPAEHEMVPMPDGSAQASAALGRTNQPDDSDFRLASNGEIIGVGMVNEVSSRVISILPRYRMATASWDEIAQTLRNVETGSGMTDVELLPGGELELVSSDEPPQPLSRLPKARMAAGNRGVSAADVDILRRLDPLNMEGWSPVSTDVLTGWTFSLMPPFPGQPTFVFLAFRSPSDGNAYRVAVLQPNMDSEFGHKPHMIHTYVGGQRIPVICGPAGKPARDLAEVRTHAAKWMAYTSARIAGRNPGFSQ